MNTEEIVEAFRRLPVGERARLLEELWDEIVTELDQQPPSEGQRCLRAFENIKTRPPTSKLGSTHGTIFSVTCDLSAGGSRELTGSV
jgi:hypothetical protein